MLDKHGFRKYLNWPEREAFFAGVMSDANSYTRTFCLTLFYTGCRISEALDSTPERLDFTSGTITFQTLKRRSKGIYRVVPIPEFLMEQLQLLEAANSSVKIWPFSRSTAYRLVRERMHGAGISGIRACSRGLRHSYGIAMVSRGVPINMVQKWLGHASLETTSIYLDFVGDEEREQAAKLWRTI